MDEPASQVEQEFKQRVVDGLRPYSSALVDVLRKLVRHEYPPEVVSLDFEVFPQSFTSAFPVRVFFMDEDNSEFFVWRGETAEYPSPVDPGLLERPGVLEEEAAQELLAADPDADDLTLAGEALIPWFSGCWIDAGGGAFSRSATIRVHDEERFFDLVQQRWQKC